MNRMLLIALAVLVPFGGLVAWGLLALREPADVTPATPAPTAAATARAPAPAFDEPPAPVAAPPVPVAEPAAPPAAGAVSDEDTAGSATEATAARAVFEQLRPLVHDCFVKEGLDTLKNEPKVLTQFSVHPDGTLADVRVKAKSRDPVLVACVTAALSAAAVDPKRGIPQLPVRHAFRFKPRPEPGPLRHP